MPNNSFNASGDSVAFIIIPALGLAWFPAAALIRTLVGCVEHCEVNLDENEDRTEWDRVWCERPLRQLVKPVRIDVAPTADPAWGRVVRVEIAVDPPQYADAIWRNSEVCPVCGEATSSDRRIAATIYPYFESGFSYGLPCWVHEACLAACEEVAGPAPVPW